MLYWAQSEFQLQILPLSAPLESGCQTQASPGSAFPQNIPLGLVISLPKMEVNLETIDRGECSDAHQKSSFTEALEICKGFLWVSVVCVCVCVCVCTCICECVGTTGMSVQGHPTMHRSVPHNMESTWLTLSCHPKGWLMDKSVIIGLKASTFPLR